MNLWLDGKGRPLWLTQNAEEQFNKSGAYAWILKQESGIKKKSGIWKIYSSSKHHAKSI